MEGQYNMRNPAVKRLMREAQELREPTEQYYAQPLEDNLFEWHFTVRGPAESDFDGGIFHGRIILPPEYPMKPPSIILLTPNGRFELHKKICLSISGHHPESWRPSWSIRTALLAIIGFMPTHGGGAIGSLEYTPEERKALSKKSQGWSCPVCEMANSDQLLPVSAASEATRAEIRQLATQIDFKGESASSSASETSEDVSAGGLGGGGPSGSSTGTNAAPTAAVEQSQVTHRRPAAPTTPTPTPTPANPQLEVREMRARRMASVGVSFWLMILLSVGIAALVLRRALLYLDENTLP